MADDILHEQTLQRVVGRCHNVLWERHGFDPAQAFDELSKLLLVKLFDESRARELATARSNAPDCLASTARRLFDRIKTSPGFDNIFVDDDRIVADDLAICEVFRHLEPYSLKETTSQLDGADVKGTIYEHIVGNTFRGELGQFFTPRSIVEFMVRLVGVNEKVTIYDPSCGSGGFFVMYAKLLREELRRKHRSMSQECIDERLREHSRLHLVGTEINQRAARVARLNLLMHGLDPCNIFNMNALKIEDGPDLRAKKLLGEESVEVVFANPPFAGHEKDDAVLRKFDLGRSRSGALSSVTREALFIERILDVLRFGGTAAIVIPQGVFTNRRLARVRDHIRKRARLLAVIELPEWAFMPSGTSVRGSLLFLRKVRRVPRDYPVFMKRVDHVGFGSTGRSTPENDLPATLEEYRRRDSRYLVPLAEVTDRIDAKFYIAEHRRTLSLFSDNPNHELLRLSDIGSFDATKLDPRRDPDREILLVETSSVDPATLRITPRRMLGRDSNHASLRQLAAGDILISRRRAYRGAVVLVPDDLHGALAIPEFSVLRVNDGFDRDYVVEIMRSPRFLELMTIYSTGEMSGRISERDLMSLCIPVPDDHKDRADDFRKHRARISALEAEIARERSTITWLCDGIVDPRR